VAGVGIGFTMTGVVLTCLAVSTLAGVYGGAFGVFGERLLLHLSLGMLL
jgi:hypothetical protein